MGSHLDDKDKIRQLFQSHQWSAEDQQWLKEYLDRDDTTELQEYLQQQFVLDLANPSLSNNNQAKEILDRIHIHSGMEESKSTAVLVGFGLGVWKKIVAAATILFVFTIAGWLILNRNSPVVSQEITVNSPAGEIRPGSNKAELMLADQTIIILDRVKPGVLAQQGDTKIIKSSDGQLRYDAGVEAGGMYNKVTTPRGGQYQLVLPDGSKVWMNAASSLRFTADFNGLDRKVWLQGEAYFEIAKNAAKPFTVMVEGRGEVVVLGTHFNINAYSNEPVMKVTLLEGSVHFNSTQTHQSQNLKPGQQAQVNRSGSVSIQQNIDTTAIVAWTNGWFNFNHLPIATIMRQIERWYDVDIKLDQSVENSSETFTGMVNRNSDINTVLTMMEAGGLKFKKEGRKIIVQH